MGEGEKVVIMSFRKDELDYIVPGTVDAKCERCGGDIVLAPSSQQLIQESPNHEVICISCLTPKEKRRMKIKVTPLQLEEIRQGRKRN